MKLFFLKLSALLKLPPSADTPYTISLCEWQKGDHFCDCKSKLFGSRFISRVGAISFKIIFVTSSFLTSPMWRGVSIK